MSAQHDCADIFGFARIGRSRFLNSLPPSMFILLHLHETEHFKFLSIGIEKMILARTDHQVRAGLRKLDYFNTIAPNNSSTGSSPKISTKAWPTVNSIIRVTKNPTGCSRTISS